MLDALTWAIDDAAFAMKLAALWPPYATRPAQPSESKKST
jgi:hypothetical protein